MNLPSDRAATALARLYQTAEARLEALIARAIASGALGTARYRAVRLAEVQRILSELQDEAVPEATQAVADAYRVGGLIAGVDTFGSSVHQDAVEVLADNLASRLNDAAEKVGRQTEDVFRREGLRHAALDLIEGGTQREASARLRETLVRQGVSSFEDRAGRQWGLASYSEMVVRTTTREAVSTATHHSLLERGDDLVTISSHRGVEPDDERCLRIQGRTFSITGRTPGYPVLPLDEWPPMGTHPRCVHVATPAAASFEALERSLGIAQSAIMAA